MGKYALYYLGSLLRKPIGDSGRRFLKNPVPEIISKLVFCPSPQSGLFFFCGGEPYRLLPWLAPARWPLYGQQRLRWSPPGVWGLYWALIPSPLIPLPFVPISPMFPFLFEFPTWDLIYYFPSIICLPNLLMCFHWFYFLPINTHFYFFSVVNSKSSFYNILFTFKKTHKLINLKYCRELKLFKSFRPNIQACFLPSTTISALICIPVWNVPVKKENKFYAVEIIKLSFFCPALPFPL